MTAEYTGCEEELKLLEIEYVSVMAKYTKSINLGRTALKEKADRLNGTKEALAKYETAMETIRTVKQALRRPNVAAAPSPTTIGIE